VGLAVHAVKKALGGHPVLGGVSFEIRDRIVEGRHLPGR
jgi:hypothetical protein